MSAKKLTEKEATRLRRRLKTRTDYYIAILLWGLFLFSFSSVWAVGTLNSEYGGLTLALQTAPIYIFFPFFATFGMISDRILSQDLLRNAHYCTTSDKEPKTMSFKLETEDYIRIGTIIGLIFISLPWITARLGLYLVPYETTIGSQVLFYQPVHVGENHGWIGDYMILSVLLISKTEKYYRDSIFKEISIFILIFLMLWGVGLLIDDFLIEQFKYDLQFIVWDEISILFGAFLIQISILASLSALIYYIAWQKYYKQRLTR